jgi:hypothetical protein
MVEDSFHFYDRTFCDWTSILLDDTFSNSKERPEFSLLAPLAVEPFKSAFCELALCCSSFFGTLFGTQVGCALLGTQVGCSPRLSKGPGNFQMTCLKCGNHLSSQEHSATPFCFLWQSPFGFLLWSPGSQEPGSHEPGHL